MGHLHLLERPGGAVPGGMRQVAGVAGRRRGVFGGEVCQLLRGVRVPREKFVPPPPPPVAEEFDLGGQVVDEESGEEAPRKMVMSTELPAIPEPEPEDEGDGEAAEDA